MPVRELPRQHIYNALWCRSLAGVLEPGVTEEAARERLDLELFIRAVLWESH